MSEFRSEDGGGGRKRGLAEHGQAIVVFGELALLCLVVDMLLKLLGF
jgi:hypothetical protein